MNEAERNGVSMDGTSHNAIMGLSAIDLLPRNYLADIMSDDYRLREKINEIAAKVNILIQLKNSELQK